MNEKNELMKPRFQLIADYPGNSQPIGNITTEVATASYFRKYHANFRELEWWQDRKPEEMPLYLKYGNNGKPRKAARYFRDKVEFEGGRIRRIGKSWLPATEQEYNEYKAPKK